LVISSTKKPTCSLSKVESGFVSGECVRESARANIHNTLTDDLHALARSHNLVLSCLGSISDQSIAGAISTATHGSGLHFGNISAYVRSLTLVLPNDPSTIVTVDAKTDPDLFYASLCGLGTTGVILRVAIKCEPLYKLEEEVWSMGFDDFVRGFTEPGKDKGGLADSAEHVRAFWFPQLREVKVSRLNRTRKVNNFLRSRFPPLQHSTDSRFPKEPTPPPGAISSYVTNSLIAHHWHQLALFIGKFFPNFLHFHAKWFYRLVHRPAPLRQSEVVKQLEKKDPSYPRLTSTTWRVDEPVSIFNYDIGVRATSCSFFLSFWLTSISKFPQYTYEGAVPVVQAQNCLRSLSSWLETEYADPNGLRHHFPIEIRLVERDDIWLSPSYGQRMCYIGIIQYKYASTFVLPKKDEER
jgi:L-gulonolactone oxidase